MSKKEKETTSESPKYTGDVSKYTKGARPVTDVTDKWIGTGPGDLQAGLTSQDLPQEDIKNLLDQDLVIIGFQRRSGTLKGKPSDYLIIIAVPTATNQPVVFITGGSVVRKKLEKAAEENALPVAAKIILHEGDDFNYYDLVS